MFLPDLLKHEHILVTGGGTGLGREMAQRFCELGAQVLICGRRTSVLDETARALTGSGPGSVVAKTCDLRDPAAVSSMVDEAWRDGGPLTGLVNNAAGNFISRTEDLSPNGFNAVSDTVLRGTFYVTHAVGKRWIAEGRGGSIVSIVASFVKTGAPFVVPSAMSKAGVEAMTKSLAVEWGRHGIRLNAISPGVFPTEGASARLRPVDNPNEYERSVNPAGRLGRMSELQNLAVFLLAPGCAWLSGETITIDGGHHLANGAYYTQYLPWSDEEWRVARDRIRGRNEQDRQARDATP